MMTTKTAGIGVDEANPKPVRHINWTGQPMKEGDNYWGESKPQEENIGTSDTDIKPLTTPSRPRKAKRERKAWSPEARAAYSQRMKAWWQAKKSSAPEAEAQEQGQQNNQQ